MKLLVRQVRDKHGTRHNILFTDESGIANPLCVIDEIAMDEFIAMYNKEQLAVDHSLVSGVKLTKS